MRATSSRPMRWICAGVSAAAVRAEAFDFALDRDDYGPELREWLTKRLAE